MITLGRPEGEVRISSMKVSGSGKVEILGHSGTVRHRVDDSGHLIIAPLKDTGEVHAMTFRLMGYQIDLQPADAESWKAVNVYQLQIAPAE